MIQCGSLINLACIQNEACLPRFEYMIMTMQILARTIANVLRLPSVNDMMQMS